jgi:chromosome segregation ATPase
MNRFLERLNLIGVLALAGLCVFQWRVNREVNTQVNRLQKTQFEQTAKIAEQQKTIAGQGMDLETFRAQLLASKSEEKQLSANLFDSERTNRQLDSQVGQLKESLTNWVAAVSERDKQLEHITANLKSLIEARDEAIEKYNTLAKTHNQLVADFNRMATNTQAKN